jgi:hypothetical protein
MPVVGPKTRVNEKEDGNDSGDDTYLLTLLVATRRSIEHLLLLSLLMLPILLFDERAMLTTS